ncbi:DUF1566 domain-containing protein [Roseicyclus sp.]|uniref:Lcl C-terminal domain-containing protein n=1 Tax=Roseicyclus sp. TaxID=1914329 RepID=UPI003F6CB3BE
MTSRAIRLLWAAPIAMQIATASASAQYYERDHFVKDLALGIEWMRCSVGQRWDPEQETCWGEAIRLNHEEIAQVIEQANAQLGEGWRLPGLDELKSLVCAECTPPKIDPLLFPNTMAEPYWSGDQNFWSPKNYWTVSFMTGDQYGRFFPEQRMMVRLVRD